MHEELLGAIMSVVETLCDTLCGGILVATGGMLVALVSYLLGTRSEKRQREKQFLESARQQLFGGNRILRAEIQAWVESARASGNRIDLYQANLACADLTGLDLSGARLERANLREANLYGAKLIKARLYQANLRGADLRGAYLDEADLGIADLRTTEDKLIVADLRGTHLCRANLFKA